MKGKRVLTKEEIVRLTDALNQRERVFCLLGATFGTRFKEAMSLRFKDFDGTTVKIKAAKGGETETYAIPPKLKEEISLLKRWYEKEGIAYSENGCMFLNRKGSPVSIQHVLQELRRKCRKLGIEGPIGTHSFRKSFVTHMHELNGGDIMKTRRYSRHKNVGNLVYYVETTMDTDQTLNTIW